MPARQPHRAAVDPQEAGLARQPLARLLQLPGHNHHGGAAGELALSELHPCGGILQAGEFRLGPHCVPQLDSVELYLAPLSDLHPGAGLVARAAVLQLPALGDLLTGV